MSGMLQRKIPSSGEMLPVIGVGTWQAFDVGSAPAEREPLARVLRVLVEHGGSVLDSSPMYGRAEAVVGDLIAKMAAREKLFVATKVWTSGREKGVEQIDRSMTLLQVKQLDLIQIHNLLDWPTQLATIRELKAQGRVRYVGITHYTDGAHAALAAVMRREAIDFVQFNYALDDRAAEQTLLPLAAERGIAVLINRPFGEGALLKQLNRRPVPGFAAELGCETWAELALKYLIANEAVTCVIPGTSQFVHMESDTRAGFGLLPDRDMRRRIVQAAGV
jgi:diketogulonate reductase-like aldo/keto reductase